MPGSELVGRSKLAAELAQIGGEGRAVGRAGADAAGTRSTHQLLLPLLRQLLSQMCCLRLRRRKVLFEAHAGGELALGRGKLGPQRLILDAQLGGLAPRRRRRRRRLAAAAPARGLPISTGRGRGRGGGERLLELPLERSNLALALVTLGRRRVEQLVAQLLAPLGCAALLLEPLRMLLLEGLARLTELRLEALLRLGEEFTMSLNFLTSMLLRSSFSAAVFASSSAWLVCSSSCLRNAWICS